VLVYFAGPDVFRPDYQEIRGKLAQLAFARGIYPLFPGEAILKGASEIVEFNLMLLRKADGVVANLNPFRGQEPDSGTIFECGYAFANGKWVIGYLSDRRDLLSKLRQWDQGPGPSDNVCRDGSFVEDFRQPVNIMPALTALSICGDAEEAIEAAAAMKAKPST
jgi:nucleoside 2-deoxyribosyltransferase